MKSVSMPGMPMVGKHVTTREVEGRHGRVVAGEKNVLVGGGGVGVGQ